MGRFLGRRLIQTVPVLLVSSVLVFLIIHLAPGNPAQTLAGPDATPAVVKAIRARLDLNGPLYKQYVSWLDGLLHGKLGQSYISSVPVVQLLPSRMVATGELIGAGAIVAIIVGVTLGSIAGFRRDGLIDSIVSWLTGIMVSTPDFWVGLLVILAFSVDLGWLPPEGRVGFTQNPNEALRFLILPTVTLAFQPIAYIARTVRASVVETLSEEYIRMARAKGVFGVRFYFRHVLKNALVPILSIVGLVLTRMLGGAIIVESVFAWPGVGLLLVSSIANRDYQVVQDTLLLFILAVVAINLLTDIAYTVVDPRMRSQAKRT